MTAQGSRRIIAGFALAVLALVAWRLWPNARTEDPGSGTTATTAQGSGRTAVSGVGDSASEQVRAGTAKQGLPAACIGWDERRMRRILRALEPERSADEAFAHGILTRLLMADDVRDPDAQRHETSRMQVEWQDARRRWPADLHIAWQAARNCDSRHGCDERGALQHLLDVDRGNAAAWLLAMDAAYSRSDFARYDAYLARAAGASHYAPRRRSVFHAFQPLFAAVPPPGQCLRPFQVARRTAMLGHEPTAEDWANETAASLEMGLGDPDDAAALAGCRSSFGIPVPERRRGDCVVVLSMLADGTTFNERETALPLLILLLGDSADGMAYREDYRRMLYLQSIEPDSGVAGTSSMDLMDRDDFEARRQRAIAQHRWPPPREWMPRWSVQKALILRGEALPPTLEE